MTGKLGAGGMGEVYRARDSRLGRDVALKLLPESLAANPERIARFEREAQLLASLNHPNIASIYGLEESEGVRCLVLELVEGPTLADRIAQGPVPLNEALPIARQIAEALEGAHEKGIIHRDLKPANVKVTPEGTVKVLDFGLAKAFESEVAGENVSASPTLTVAATQAGVIIGTAAYMSPEQARAKAADRRADVWAFGCVLYEMLTGKRAFDGESVSDTLAAVLKTDPDWDLLPAEVPATLRQLLRRCLQKDRKLRLQAIGEARIVMDEFLAGRAEEGQIAPQPPATGSGRRAILAAAVGVVLVAVAIVIGFRFGRSGAEQELPWRTFTIAAGQTATQPSISPDGKHIAYTTRQAEQFELWIQDLNQNIPRRVAGSQAALSGPFWSPDSQYVGFAEGKDLKKVSDGGGPSVTICPLPDAFITGATWSPDGETIVFGSGPSWRLYEVPAVGGSPKAPFVPDKADAKSALTTPFFLPTTAGDRKLIYVRATSPTEGQIVARDLKTGRTEVVAAGVGAVYSATGHVLFRAQSGLWAVRFSMQDLRPSGEPFPIREGVRDASVARDGTLVYHETGGGGSVQLVWKSRTGEKLGVIGQPQESIFTPLLSPDGTKVAVWGHENGNDDIWIQDVARGLKTRLTFDPAGEDRPIWSPDGRRVAFASDRSGNWDVFVKAADGTGEVEPLLATPNADYITNWSRDGKYLVFDYIPPAGRLAIGYLLGGAGETKGKVVPFLATQFEVGGSDLSPDGRFLAYRSNESGRNEVYVQRFPEGGDRVQVSTNGGVQPRWRGDGRELYYVEGETLVAVPISTTPKFSVGKATRLFEQPGITRRTGQQYDVSRDGKRFVVIEPVGADASNAIRVVQNWFAEFRNKNQQDK